MLKVYVIVLFEEVDGSVYKHGKLIRMCYDEEGDKYYELKNGKKELIKKFEMYR